MESNSGKPDPEVNQENTDEETHNEEGFDEFFEEKIGHGKRANTSLSWEYFDVKDSKLRLAICKLCSCEISYRSSVSNLMKHVKRKHIVGKIDGGKSEVNQESTDDESHNEEEGFDEFFEEKVGKRANPSLAWQFFEVKDSKRRSAICKLCSLEMSYRASVSNLMKHVKRKHIVALNSCKIDGSRSAPDRQHALRDTVRSSLWNYYKRFDNIEKIAECLVCKKQLSYKNITNLRKHLKRQHPNLKVEGNKQVIVDSDGQLYEIEETNSELIQNLDKSDDEQPLDIDTVFINDFEGDILESKRKNKVLERNGKRRKILIQDIDENDSTDEITFQKRYVRKHNDSLDQFGKYLISIMRQLPKELSNQLQVDFVKQVMTTQLTYETQQKASVQKNDYAITITDNGSHNTVDHQYVIEEHVVESVET